MVRVFLLAALRRGLRKMNIKYACFISMMRAKIALIFKQMRFLFQIGRSGDLHYFIKNKNK